MVLLVKQVIEERSSSKKFLVFVVGLVLLVSCWSCLVLVAPQVLASGCCRIFVSSLVSSSCLGVCSCRGALLGGYLEGGGPEGGGIPLSLCSSFVFCVVSVEGPFKVSRGKWSFFTRLFISSDLAYLSSGVRTRSLHSH